MMAMVISTPPMVGVPAFFWCALRAFFADVLPDLEFAQLADDGRTDDQSHEESGQAGESSAKGQETKDTEWRKERVLIVQLEKDLLIKQPIEQSISTLLRSRHFYAGFPVFQCLLQFHAARGFQ